MTKRSLIILFLIPAFYVLIQWIFGSFLLASPWLNQSFMMLYAWSPGLVGLYFARKEGISLPIFSKLNKWFYLIPLTAFLIAAVGFLLSIPFRGPQATNPQFAGQSIGGIIGYLILFFFIGFVFISILLSFIFLGGELYWRGYFWEKVKKWGPLKTIFLTALIWSVWQLPSGFLFNRLVWASFVGFLAIVLAFNFILAPILTYFRLKTGSIMGAAYMYSCLVAGFLFFLIVFPPADFKSVAVTFSCTFIGLILFSLIFKLYSPETWKKLV